MIEAVVFDLDGVLLDSEQLWDRARRETVDEHGGEWRPGATEAMQGMSSPEWSAYLQRNLGIDLPQEEIVSAVVDKLLQGYRRELPLLPGAVDAVERIGRIWRLGLASSANRVVIDTVLDLARFEPAFEACVSSEEVRRGKPAPDVYLAVAGQLGLAPSQCCAVEDSANGIRSGVAAGMSVIAIPNQHFPPPPAGLRSASLVLSGLDGLTVEAVRLIDREAERRLDEVEDESFPASDPHADWAGPP